MNPILRNIFAFEDEDEEWKSVLSQFPNRVPRFDTKEEAIEFTKRHCRRGSNPDYPHLQHSITTLVDWSQVESILLPKIREYDSKWPPRGRDKANLCEEKLQQAIDEQVKPIFDYAKSRLDLPIHKEMSSQSRMNTLKYTFYHMKCGIYVMIRQGQVVIFAPFVNRHYTNTWGDALKLDSSDGSIEGYVIEKKSHYPNYPINYLDKSQWWANGNIICNDYGGGVAAVGSSSNANPVAALDESSVDESTQYWGDHFLLQLKDMFAELCRCRDVPDCEFFMNKRDYPQLKFNPHLGVPVEPYGFIFDKDDNKEDEDVLLSRHRYQSYAPIMSFYLSQRFADLPIPPTEDW